MLTEKSQLLSYQNISMKSMSMDKSYDHERQYARRLVVLRTVMYLVTIPVIITIALIYIFSEAKTYSDNHPDHTIPTSSSTQSSETTLNGEEGVYVDSLDNILYQLIKEAEFNIDHDVKNDGSMYQIETDKDEIYVHDNLTVIWKYDGDVDTENYNHGDDLIALYCPANETNPKKFIDAATISQIEATNLTADEKSGLRRKMTITNEWFIPSFPVVKADNCDYRLWIRGHNEYHADEMGRQVARYDIGATTKSFVVQTNV